MAHAVLPACLVLISVASPPPAPPSQLEQAEGEAAEAKDAADQTAAALHELRQEMCEVVAENDELRGSKAALFQQLVAWKELGHDVETKLARAVEPITHQVRRGFWCWGLCRSHPTCY